MSLTELRPLPAFLALSVLLAWPEPAYARAHTHQQAQRRAAAISTSERIGLYAPRVRRSTVMYLRLRLLELREAGLDRARAAIERRLSIDELLAEPPRPQHLEDEPHDPLRSQRAPFPY